MSLDKVLNDDCLRHSDNSREINSFKKLFSVKFFPLEFRAYSWRYGKQD